jgi:hypothetical protein
MTMPVSDAKTEAILAMLILSDFSLASFESRLPSIEAKWVATPIPMLLHCPACHERHIDEGEVRDA